MSAVRLIASLVLAGGSIAAQQLVLDVNSQPEPLGVGSMPAEFVALDGWVYFVATTPETGRELWRSDGTQGELVADLMPGVANSLPAELTVFDGGVFFVATTPDSGRELMRTDGTAAGTFVVRELGLADVSSSPRELFVHDGLLYFSAAAATSPFGGFGQEPWVTDGTEVGTRFLADLAATGSSNPADFAAHGALVFFTAEGDGVGRELYVTDGTPIGTSLVADVRPGPGGSDPADLVSYDGSLFFVARHGTSGSAVDVWRTDGTLGGTSIAIDAATVSFAEELVVFDGALFFQGWTSGAGRELMRSLGSDATTTLFAELNPGSGSSTPSEFTPVGDTLFFSANAPDTGRELYATDGATVTLLEIVPGTGSGVPVDLTPLGASVVFATSSGDEEPWVSDGTPGGTLQLADLLASGSSEPHDLRVVAPGEVWFAALGTGVGNEVWRTDGTPGGTSLVVDVVGQQDTASADPRGFTTLLGRSYFAADDGVHGVEPWVTDGTSAGTHMLADLRTGPDGSNPGAFHGVGSRVVFVADGDTGLQLHGTDGAAVEVIDPSPGGSDSRPAHLTVIDDLLYVTLRTDGPGDEPWVSDGTLAGTVSLGDLNPGPSRGSYGDFTPFDGQVVFAGHDGVNGLEPWITDGTPAGTQLFIDVKIGFDGVGPQAITPFKDGEFAFLGTACGNPGVYCQQVFFSDGTNAQVVFTVNGENPPGSLAKDLTAANDRLFWRARPANPGQTQRYHLYGSNGKAAGSYDLFAPGPEGDVAQLIALGDDALVFAVTIAGAPDEVWISGGKPETTSMLWSGGDLTLPLVATPNAVFFVEDGEAGSERLWATDGTPGGTQLVAEPDPLPEHPSIETVADVRPLGSGDRVIFAGTDASGGREPWVAGTTPGSSQRVADLVPGGTSSTPDGFARAGDTIVFAADDPTAGRELFAVPMSATGGWALDVFGDVCATSSGHDLRLDVSGTAVGGDALEIGLLGADGATLAGLYFSFDTATVPLGDCTLHLADPLLLLALVPVAPDGSASFTLPVPSKASLQGQDFAFQYAIDDAGGPILGVAALSDALEIVIGSD